MLMIKGVAKNLCDEIDHCCFGFLKSKVTKFSSLYEGVLGKISEVLPGRSIDVIISCLPEEMIKHITINSVDVTDSK